MKAVSATSSYIIFIANIVVMLTLVSVFTTQIIAPGIDSMHIIESASLGNTIASVTNALSVQEEGEVIISFPKDYRVATGIEGGKNFIYVEDKEKKVFFQSKLKSLFDKTIDGIKISKKPGELMEVVPA